MRLALSIRNCGRHALTGFAAVFALHLQLAAARAQGSTGGSIGKQDKSVSGDQDESGSRPTVLKGTDRWTGGTCFTRQYSAEHLKEHSRQVVTSMRVSIEDSASTREVGYPYLLRMGIKLRGSGNELRSEALCTLIKAPEKVGLLLRCKVECDGGGVAVESTRDGKAVRVHLAKPLGDGSIRLTTSCDSKSTDKELSAGDDDKLFRLDAAPGACSFKSQP